jgi:methionine synthase I (cobalamin-dependent)
MCHSQANEAAPETVQAAHAEYIAAGCRCITTNNFVATRYSLAKVQREEDVTKLTQVRLTVHVHVHTCMLASQFTHAFIVEQLAWRICILLGGSCCSKV